MKAIILVGKQNHGKTTILRQVINAMLDQPKKFRIIKSHFKDLRFYDDTTKDAFHDCYAVFEYQGKKILIITYGDAVREIESRYQNVKKDLGEIDLLICASHPGILDKVLQSFHISDFHKGKSALYSVSIDTPKTLVVTTIMNAIRLPFENLQIDICSGKNSE